MEGEREKTVNIDVSEIDAFWNEVKELVDKANEENNEYLAKMVRSVLENVEFVSRGLESDGGSFIKIVMEVR